WSYSYSWYFRRHSSPSFPTRRSSDLGWYIEPTIFDHITPEDRLFQEEVFGPVLAVTTFETEEQAIALANDTQYGLAASIYTLDVDRKSTRLNSSHVKISYAVLRLKRK